MLDYVESHHPLYSTPPILWSRICGFIPYIHHDFWGVLNIRGKRLPSAKLTQLLKMAQSKQCIYPLKIVIFHSYDSLMGKNCNFPQKQWIYPLKIVIFHSQFTRGYTFSRPQKFITKPSRISRTGAEEFHWRFRDRWPWLKRQGIYCKYNKNDPQLFPIVTIVMTYQGRFSVIPQL